MNPCFGVSQPPKVNSCPRNAEFTYLGYVAGPMGSGSKKMMPNETYRAGLGLAESTGPGGRQRLWRS